MPSITKQSPSVPSAPVTEIPESTTGFIRLPDNELYFYNGASWVGLNGARVVCHLDADVTLNDAVVVEEGTARVASSDSDKYCSGIVTHITPARHGVIVSAGRINKVATLGEKYFLGIGGALTASPNPDSQHIVLVGTGEGDTLLVTLGVTSEAPI